MGCVLGSWAFALTLQPRLEKLDREEEDCIVSDIVLPPGLCLEFRGNKIGVAPIGTDDYVQEFVTKKGTTAQEALAGIKPHQAAGLFLPFAAVRTRRARLPCSNNASLAGS